MRSLLPLTADRGPVVYRVALAIQNTPNAAIADAIAAADETLTTGATHYDGPASRLMVALIDAATELSEDVHSVAHDAYAWLIN